MTGNHRPPVTIVGLGSMGSALAEAFVSAGHPTTVWNRTASKATRLVHQGAVHAQTLDQAVAASPLIITCLTTYQSTAEALEPVAAALTGRSLVTLNSGSPSGARMMAHWAAKRGVRYLDGAIKNVPSAVGAEDTLLYYSGSRAVFDEFGSTLRVLGGDTVYLGDDPDLAALYEMAVGGTLLPALIGFFQGAAALQSRGLSVTSMVRFSIKWFEMINAILPTFAREIDSGDYGQPGSSVNLFVAAIADDEELAGEANLNMDWQKPMHDLLRSAAEAGHGDHSISSLVEVLKNPC